MSVAEKITEFFNHNEWPACSIVVGKNTTQKSDFIKNQISRIFYENQLNDLDLNYHEIGKMVYKNEHPDLYIFPLAAIKIGKDRNEAGTIRHMTGKFLPYSGYKSSKRIVFFEDASLIHSEAESALLKSMEEPPDYLRFILSVENAESLKDTILSRSIQIPFFQEVQPSIPDDPWEAFWYFSGYDNEPLFITAKTRDWPLIIKKNYDQLNYTINDYILFETLGWSAIRELFKKNPSNEQLFLLKTAFLPLYYALRDKIIYGGMIPSISPITIPFKNKKKLYCLFKVLTQLFHDADTRIFGKQPLSYRAVFFSFLSKITYCWQIPENNRA